MIKDQVIHQCEVCFRFFESKDGQMVMVSKPANCGELIRASLLKSFSCEWPDCAAVREKAMQPRATQPARKTATVERRFIRGCPDDTEFVDDAADRLRDSGRESSTPPIETPDHKTQVEDYGSGGEAENQNELMLTELRKGFDQSRPTIPGAWVNNARLKFELKIGCPNNRAIDLRGGKRIKTAKGWTVRDAHWFLKKYDLDVDCSQIENKETEAQHFAYRLCLKSQSTRLKREADKDVQQGQSTLPT